MAKGKIEADKYAALIATKVDDNSFVQAQKPVLPVDVSKKEDENGALELETLEQKPEKTEAIISKNIPGAEKYMNVFRKHTQRKTGTQIRVAEKTHQLLTMLTVIENDKEDGGKIFIQDIMNNILDEWVSENKPYIEKSLKKMAKL